MGTTLRICVVPVEETWEPAAPTEDNRAAAAGPWPIPLAKAAVTDVVIASSHGRHLAAFTSTGARPVNVRWRPDSKAFRNRFNLKELVALPDYPEVWDTQVRGTPRFTEVMVGDDHPMLTSRFTWWTAADFAFNGEVAYPAPGGLYPVLYLRDMRILSWDPVEARHIHDVDLSAVESDRLVFTSGERTFEVRHVQPAEPVRMISNGGSRIEFT